MLQLLGCGARRMAESAALLVDEVLPHKPMRQWALSVLFPLRFLFASQPRIMGKALGIVYRTLATHLTRKTGYTNATARTGAVTLIQCFGSALNLNIHFHMLFLDGVYTDDRGRARFRWVKAPMDSELTELTHTIMHRMARHLQRQGLLERDAEHSYLTLQSEDEDPMDQLRGHSIKPAPIQEKRRTMRQKQQFSQSRSGRNRWGLLNFSPAARVIQLWI